MELELEKEQLMAEKEKVKMYIEYLSHIFSQPVHKPSQNYLRAKRQFEDLISVNKNRKRKEKAKVYEWDFEREARLKDSQKGG